MNNKEFVLVSQGIEIMRTKSQENAINYVKKENDEWFDYKQRCIDNYEDYADNYINLEIEYPKDKRYLQLQSNWNSLRELIKWRPIEEYDENKYDWVLVKYYDEDYECVPTVAERRKGTNKWYDTNNNEIIFEVKYFFDMQLLDKMNELESGDNNA